MSSDTDTLRFDSNRWQRLPGVRDIPDGAPTDLLQFERRGSLVWARRRASWIVGRAELNGVALEVPSPLPAGVLVPLVLYADGVDLSVMRSLPLSATEGRGSTFQVGLANALLREVASRIGTDGSRSYVIYRECAQILRGRPIWTSTFGKHPSSGVQCQTHQLATDHVLNQLILAAIERAHHLVREDREAKRAAARLIAYWRMIAAPCVPTSELFDLGFRRLNRLTERYRIPLQLARSLVLRIQHDPFHAGGAPAPAVALNLAVLLEGVVGRIINDAVRAIPGADILLQHSDETSFVDNMGDPYRSVRPDLLLRSRGVPVAVFDAKFKPRYVEGPPQGRLPGKNRLTTSDLFQIAFYQVRTQQRFGLSTPPIAAIIAPDLEERPVSPPARRTVRWLAEADGLGACVVPLPLAELVHSLREARDAARIIDVAPELRELVYSALQAPRAV